jgi:hypothetical protein
MKSAIILAENGRNSPKFFHEITLDLNVSVCWQCPFNTPCLVKSIVHSCVTCQNIGSERVKEEREKEREKRVREGEREECK